MDRSKVAIVIPAYNEERTISGIVYSVSKFGIPIVIDDYSNDSTKILAHEAGAIVISHKFNKGYDGALNSGYKRAHELGMQACITFDADGQHKESLLEQFIEKIDNGSDLVLGTRNSKARIAEVVFGITTSFLFNIPDPLCGLKAYNLNFFSDKVLFDSYSSIGTELMLYGITNNATYSFVDVPVQPRNDGAPRFGTLLTSNFKIFRSLIFGALKYGVNRSEK